MIFLLENIFKRLLYLYRKEDDRGLDSALNYMSLLIVCSLLSVVFTLYFIIFGYRNVLGISKTLMPIFLIILFFLARFYAKKKLAGDKNKLNFYFEDESRFSFNLFQLYLIVIFILSIPVIAMYSVK